jgi:hypothetical protein
MFPGSASRVRAVRISTRGQVEARGMKLTYEQLLAKVFCGARTRAGTPCKRRDLYWSGRCRLHGGLSTGPRTQAGKAKAALNGLRPKRKRTP